ncbi:hypothetical protein DM806_09535 [Sphingobium lactosutens]|uniref:hypothetical protein n=1 Tax=Sphingobium lactosutens TaxID=522773 RepID=UPI0015C02C56|nr:hypothetical protein [Sphingobium lactosutens]NWK95912.1 hypothetical protein [Sphingobium lactosutens]
MACCLIAAFLVAQAMAMLRRWAVFWGLMPVPEGEVADTVFTRIAAFLRRPRVRMAILALLVVELAGVGTWLYRDHAPHIAQLADIGWSRLHGQHVVYADMCGVNGEQSVRLVIDADGSRHRSISG